MASVRQYVEAFNEGDSGAWQETCAGPDADSTMMCDVWQDQQLARMVNDVLAAASNVGASVPHSLLDEPRHVSVDGDFGCRRSAPNVRSGRQGGHSDRPLSYVSLRKVDRDWRLSAWAWAKEAEES